MDKFNLFEKKLARALSHVPLVKNLLKYTYQYANYFINRKNYKCKCIYSIEAVDNSTCESFFGYYDKSPENLYGDHVIYQVSGLPTKNLPRCNYPISIKLKNNYSEAVSEVDSSNAYNWQQGTKLQWINNESFIYNIYNNRIGIYSSKIYNIKKKTYKELDSPIYDVFNDEYGLTLNFNRLNHLRPDYGYRCINKKINLSNSLVDGVFQIDLTSGVKRLIISLDRLSNFKPRVSMIGAEHKVNHIMIAPNGKRFMFLHRWFSTSGKKYDRLILADNMGKNLNVLADENIVSHCCWYDNDTIVGYFNHNSYGENFYKIDLKTNNTSLLSESLINFGDGHPTFNGNKLLFDSYPDRSRMKHLYIYDIKSNSVREIGEFYESMKYFGETRCDLHPKWSLNKKCIYFDSVHEGKRKLYKIQINR